MNNMEFEELIGQHEKLIWWVINRKFPTLVYNEEVYQAGMIGLWKAGKKYDEDRGATWSSFAIKVITNEILMSLRKNKKWNATPFVWIDDDDVHFDAVDETCPFDMVLEKDNIEDMVSRLFPKLSMSQRYFLLEVLRKPFQSDKALSKHMGGQSLNNIRRLRSDVRKKFEMIR
jgi:RNA polymerase sigma factor (sigma-70 family)